MFNGENIIHIKIRGFLIKFLILIKSVFLITTIISVVYNYIDYIKLSNSTFAENKSLANKFSFIEMYFTLLFIVTVFMSLLIDFREIKINYLKNKWYLVSLILLLEYLVLIKIEKTQFIIFTLFTGFVLLILFIWMPALRSSKSN